MLNVLRDSFKQSPYLKWVLLLVGLALLLYLGSYFNDAGSRAGAAANWVARVNGNEIPDWRLRDSARNLDSYYSRIFGDNYEQLRGQLQLREQALQSLIEHEMILQDAKRLGLVGNKFDLAERIRTHPSLQTAEGTFVGKERYQQIMDRNYAGGAAAFEAGVREEMIVEQWTHLVTRAVDVTEKELERLFRERTVKTSFDYVLVATDADAVNEPDEAALRRWYDGHPDDYQLEQGRRIRYVVVDRDAQLADVEIAADEIQRYYDENQGEYTNPEQREARHILFRVPPDSDEATKTETRAKAQEALDRARAGEDFTELARTLSEDPVSAARGGDLGYFGRGDMVGPFETAAFGTDVGSMSEVVESPFGFHVIEVTGAREAGAAPLADVEEQIRQTLALERADELVSSESERIQALIESPEQLASVAASEGLEIETLEARRGDRLREVGASPDFVSTVQSLAAGSVSRPLRLTTGMAIVVVDEELPRILAPFEDVRDRVVEDLSASLANEAALAAARAAVEGTDSIAEAANELGLEVQTAKERAPGQRFAVTGGDGTELHSLFADDVEVGQRGVLEVPAGALVYEVTDRVPFDAVRFVTDRPLIRRELVEQKRASYVKSLMNSMRPLQTVEINHARAQAVVPIG